ncbi:MAG: 1,4-dihydroxy-2-naphthoyl-CoA synthase [Alphaproteobacteria bacterium]|nr:1,4-dihydroxy-2-naphthoyl-CoA synthase [Alphaproteobacteria bacterium]
MPFTDIRYHVLDHVATITINRPEVLNAFRERTVDELIEAIGEAGWDKRVAVVVLTGAGDRAFCTGGDQKARGPNGYGTKGAIGLRVEELHGIIRDIPKPVIARVQGYAMGGGNVLAVVCDLTIAADTAVFGQVGPRVGSVDPGFGTAYLARLVGEKKAREIWYLCRRYSAAEALAMGMINQVVPLAELDAEVARWAQEIVAMSGTAIALAKQSFNADSDHIKGIGQLGMQALTLYYQTEEAQEGVRAFIEKRRPDFVKFRR